MAAIRYQGFLVYLVTSAEDAARQMLPDVVALGAVEPGATLTVTFPPGGVSFPVLLRFKPQGRVHQWQMEHCRSSSPYTPVTVEEQLAFWGLVPCCFYESPAWDQLPLSGTR